MSKFWLGKKPNPSEATQDGARIPADNPISTPEQDVLGRNDSARCFANEILSIDSSEGCVVGVLGPWGSGKTSFVNLVRQHLKKSEIVVLDFNPWMFSGTDQLIELFFLEISAGLKLRPSLKEVGKRLEEFGETISRLGGLPFVGSWAARCGQAVRVLGRLFGGRDGSHQRRNRVRDALRKLDKPIVVFLDDIDRLTTSEIRDVFKLIRLIANFPNLIYVVSFDRARVEKALDEQAIPGGDYLEKILQSSYDLPAIPRRLLDQEIFRAIEQALSPCEENIALPDDFRSGIFVKIIRPLVRNIRDVRRYALAIRASISDVGRDVASEDLLALEAIRVFLPDVFSELATLVELLTATNYHLRPSSERERGQIERLCQLSKGRDDVVRSLITLIFPAADHHIGNSCYGTEWSSKWLRDRRVAHPDILRRYLERYVDEEMLSVLDARQAWVVMEDSEQLDRHLRSVPVERRTEVIGLLEIYESDFRPNHVLPACPVFLNLLPNLSNQDNWPFSFLGSAGRVRTLVLRLLRCLKDQDKVENAVQNILPKIRTLDAKRELIQVVGYLPNAGHKLVSQAAADGLERAWRAELRAWRISLSKFLSPRTGRSLRALYRDSRLSRRYPSPPTFRVSRRSELDLGLWGDSFSSSRLEKLGGCVR